MSLSQYSYASGNWAEFVSRCEKTGKGMIALSLTNYDNNNACEIAEGSVVEINGAVFRQESGNTSITGTPANNAVNYILLSAANNAATASWNNSAPAWNTTYQGYYSGTNRYIGQCYYDGANYTGKVLYGAQSQTVDSITPGDGILHRQLSPMLYDRRYTTPAVSDFISSDNNGSPPFTTYWWGTAPYLNATGSFLNHSGIVTIRHGTLGNGGGGLGLYTGSMYSGIKIGGGDTFDLIFSIPVTNSSGNLTTARIGFHDANNSTIYIDAAILYVNGNTLDGRTSTNNVGNTTGTNYTIAANTWYRGMVKIADAANRVDFKLWAENGVLLWSDNLTTNVPYNRTLGVSGCAHNPQNGNSVSVIAFDWMCYYSTKMQIR